MCAYVCDACDIVFNLDMSYSIIILSFQTNTWFVWGTQQKRCACVDIMNPNFGLVAQSRIVGCPYDMYNKYKIQKGCFNILKHKVWVQDMKL